MASTAEHGGGMVGKQGIMAADGRMGMGGWDLVGPVGLKPLARFILRCILKSPAKSPASIWVLAYVTVSGECDDE